MSDYFFRYGASIRIMGKFLVPDEITKKLKIEPDLQYKRGDVRNGLKKNEKIWDWGMWSLSSPLKRTMHLDKHLLWLHTTLCPQYRKIRELKGSYKVDVFATYNSNCETAGIEVSYEAMEIYRKLDLGFGLSIIVF